MFGKHCSDEQLIAALDGELSARERARVAKHLGVCWACRARQAELETQIHQLTRAAADSIYPGADWSTRAKRRFAADAAEEERRAETKPERNWLRRWAWVGVAAGLTAALLTVIPALERRQVKEQAQTGLEQLIQTEREVRRGAIHQVMRVEVRQSKPVKQKRQGRLEVWSDPESRSHALHWSEAGELKQAAWRSSGEEEGLTPGLTAAGVRNGVLAEMVQRHWTAEEAEEEFLGWLAGRVWEPVVLSEDFGLFVASSGTTLRAEQRPGGLVRLTATRASAQVVTEWTVEMDTATKRPRLQSIRWERPEAAMELRFVTEFEARVQPGTLRPAVFASPFAVERTAPRASAPPEPAMVPERPLARLPVDLTAAGIRAEYALRRLPEDWVEALEVEFGQEEVVVRGVTATAAMRERIGQVLAALDHVRIEVQSVEEAVAETGIEEVPPLAVESNTDRPYPLEKQLAKRLEAPGDKEETARRVAEFAREAARLSARVLAEAWALHRLDERYPEARVALVKQETRWLLDELRDSHLRSLRQARAELWDLVAPVVGPLASGIAEPGPVNEAPEAQDAAEKLLATATIVDRTVRGLLAGAGLEENRPEVAVRKLLSALERLEPEAREAAAAWVPEPRE